MNTPYSDGRLAFFEDIPIDDNPYDSGTEEAIEWQAGWFYAEYYSGNDFWDSGLDEYYYDEEEENNDD